MYICISCYKTAGNQRQGKSFFKEGKKKNNASILEEQRLEGWLQILFQK